MPRMTTHLIIGAGGQIGSALSEALGRANVTVIGTMRHAAAGSLQLDLANVANDWCAPHRPDVVYLCAAMTNLAACERDPNQAYAVNVAGPLQLSQRLAATGAFCVFLSTNAVFDGLRRYPTSDDPTSPANLYGRLKAEAETRLRDIWQERLAVLRLTKVFHATMPLLDQWTTDLRGARPVSAFEDMLFAPISMQATVTGILAIAAAKVGGIYHLSGERDVSYLAAAKTLAGAMGVPETLVMATSWREVPGLVAPPPATALGMGPRERGLTLQPQTLNDVIDALVRHTGAMGGRKGA